MTRLLRFGTVLVLLGALVACASFGAAPELPTPAPPPPPDMTAPPPTATRGALATATPGAAPPPPAAPSATPDPTVVSEVYLSPRSVLSFRYPAGWDVSDSSDEGETLVTAEGTLPTGQDGFFIVNLLNADGQFTADDFRALANTYLGNVLGEAYDPNAVTYREAGDALIATVVTDREGEAVQLEVRFAPRPPFYLVLVLIAAQAEWDAVAPTLDAMARSVAVNPEMGTFIPTPTPAADRVSEGLTVQNGSLYLAPTGSLYLVGEVANESGQAYEDVQPTLVLLDAEGNELDRLPWTIERRLLPPGQRSPFVAIFSRVPDGWADWRATVEARPADYYAARISQAFEVGEVAPTEAGFAAYALAGQVTNTGEDVRNVKVIGALYDASGRVLSVTNTPLEQDVLRAGETQPFSLVFFSKADGDVARHEVWVEGTRLSPQE